MVQKPQLRSPFRLYLNLRLHQVQLRCFSTIVCYRRTMEQLFSSVSFSLSLLLEQVAFDNCKHRLRTIHLVLMFRNKSFSEFFWLKLVEAVHSYASGQSGSARVERIDMSWHLDSLAPAIALSATKSLLKSFFIPAADRKSKITPASLRITHHFQTGKMSAASHSVRLRANVRWFRVIV